MRQNLFKTFDDPSGDVLLKEMAEACIEVTVLLALDLGMGEPALYIDEQNRMLAELCRRHPIRLISFAGIEPRREAAKVSTRYYLYRGKGGNDLLEKSNEYSSKERSLL